MLEIVFVEFTLVHLVPAIVAELAGKVDAINSALTAQIKSGNLIRNIRRGYWLYYQMSRVKPLFICVYLNYLVRVVHLSLSYIPRCRKLNVKTCGLPGKNQNCGKTS